MSSILSSLQQQLADKLQADIFCEDVPVLSENLKDINYLVDVAVKKIGACILVVTPVANTSFPDKAGPYFNQVIIVVRCMENPIINRATGGSGKTALEMAEHVAAILHHFIPEGHSEAVRAVSPTIVIGNDPVHLSYDVRFETGVGVQYEVPRLAEPTVTAAAGEVTVAHATPGAASFYTLDGKPPTPRVGTLYTTPLPHVHGQRIRVKTWLAGFIASPEVDRIL